MPFDGARELWLDSTISCQVQVPQTASEWADDHYWVGKDKWKTLPFQTAILNAMGSDSIQQVVVKKSARVGYSQMLLADMCYKIAHKSRDQIIWQPTDKEAQHFSKDELGTCIDNVAMVRERFPWYGRQGGKNAIDYKEFTTAKVHILGANTPNAFARRTASDGKLDEYSRMPSDVGGKGGEGSSFELAWKRSETEPFRKLIAGSSPTIKDLCPTESAEQDMEERFERYVPCLHCDHFQTLKFGGRDSHYGFKWDSGKPKTVKYLCESCGVMIENPELKEMDSRGYWLSKNNVKTFDSLVFVKDREEIPTPESLGFRIWTAYSPFAPWHEMITTWLRAQGRVNKLKTFVNTTLGETYDELKGESISPHQLEERLEDYEFPANCCYITCGVDTQSYGWDVQFMGWGPGYELWILEYQIVKANPQRSVDWEEYLWPVLQRTFKHPNGVTLSARRIGIDTGGDATLQAYQFCVEHERDGVLAMKGVAGDKKPIIPLRHSKNWKHENIKGWNVGSWTGKAAIYGMLNNKTPGPGYVHFFREKLPEHYFTDLVSNKRIMKMSRSGHQHYEWLLPSGKKDEPLDCSVYGLAALENSRVDLVRELEQITRKEPKKSMKEFAKELNG